MQVGLHGRLIARMTMDINMFEARTIKYSGEQSWHQTSYNSNEICFKGASFWGSRGLQSGISQPNLAATELIPSTSAYEGQWKSVFPERERIWSMTSLGKQHISIEGNNPKERPVRKSWFGLGIMKLLSDYCRRPASVLAFHEGWYQNYVHVKFHKIRELRNLSRDFPSQ